MTEMELVLSKSQLESFFEKVDLSRPGLGQVRDAVEKGDLVRAKAAICKHFRTREQPRYLYDASDLVGVRFPYVFEEAERACSHYLFGQLLGEQIDWRANPIKDPEWLWSLHRVPYWVTLGRAYHQLRDEKYAIEFFRLFWDWYEKNPVSEFKDYTTYEELRQLWLKRPVMWREIETAIRIYTAFLPCLLLFRDSPHFTDDILLLMLLSIWEHAEHLRTHFSARRASLNYMMMECAGLWQAGVMFPEFKMSDTWKEVALERLVRELPAQVYPDGGHKEVTPVYALVSTMAPMQNYILAKRNGRELPEVIPATVEKMLEWLSLLVKPDWTTPMLGDADLNDLSRGKADSALYEGMNITNDLLDLNDLRAAFRMGAELFGRTDFLWMSTLGKAGHPPSRLSAILPDSGLYVMRSGWSEVDSYAFLACAKMEPWMRISHRHGDALHFELCAHGQTLLTDSGRRRYWTIEPWYFPSTRAHNTVMVDGKEQQELKKGDELLFARFPDSTCHRWYTSELFDWADVSHDGYERLHDPVTHRRRVAFVKPDYWVVEDMLDGRGKHDFELLWHFVPGQATIESDGVVVFETASDIKLLVQGLEDPGSLEIIEGQKDPMEQGWVSFGYGHMQPAPVLRMAKTTGAPTRFVTLLVPFRGESRPRIRKTTTERLLVIEVDRGSGFVDLLLLPQRDATAEELKESTFDGDFAFVREEQCGQVTRALLVGGTKVEWGGSLLLESEKTIGVLQLKYEGDKVLVTTSEALEGLRLNLFGAQRIVINMIPLAVEVTEGIASVRLR